MKQFFIAISLIIVTSTEIIAAPARTCSANGARPSLNLAANIPVAYYLFNASASLHDLPVDTPEIPGWDKGDFDFLGNISTSCALAYSIGVIVLTIANYVTIPYINEAEPELENQPVRVTTRCAPIYFIDSFFNLVMAGVVYALLVKPTQQIADSAAHVQCSSKPIFTFIHWNVYTAFTLLLFSSATMPLEAMLAKVLPKLIDCRDALLARVDCSCRCCSCRDKEAHVAHYFMSHTSDNGRTLCMY